MRTDPLPEPTHTNPAGKPFYTEAQMRAYALAEREACAKVCDEAHELMNSSFQGAAEVIRARG
jgi:hypothetical protein